jgi:hypothetical protein
MTCRCRRQVVWHRPRAKYRCWLPGSEIWGLIPYRADIEQRICAHRQDRLKAERNWATSKGLVTGRRFGFRPFYGVCCRPSFHWWEPFGKGNFLRDSYRVVIDNSTASVGFNTGLAGFKNIGWWHYRNARHSKRWQRKTPSDKSQSFSRKQNGFRLGKLHDGHLSSSVCCRPGIGWTRL